MAGDREEFPAFAVRVLPQLRRLGHLLAGDRDTADQLVRTTLETLFVTWPRLREEWDPPAAARTLLVRHFLATRRRRWVRPTPPDRAAAPIGPAGAEDPAQPPSEVKGPEVEGPEVEDPEAEHADVLDLLGRLPPRQRAAVVLRYLEDLPVEEIADLLEVSAGTVQRCCEDALRRLPPPPPALSPEGWARPAGAALPPPGFDVDDVLRAGRRRLRARRRRTGACLLAALGTGVLAVTAIGWPPHPGPPDPTVPIATSDSRALLPGTLSQDQDLQERGEALDRALQDALEAVGVAGTGPAHFTTVGGGTHVWKSGWVSVRRPGAPPEEVSWFQVGFRAPGPASRPTEAGATVIDVGFGDIDCTRPAWSSKYWPERSRVECSVERFSDGSRLSTEAYAPSPSDAEAGPQRRQTVLILPDGGYVWVDNGRDTGRDTGGDERGALSAAQQQGIALHPGLRLTPGP